MIVILLTVQNYSYKSLRITFSVINLLFLIGSKLVSLFYEINDIICAIFVILLAAYVLYV